MTATQPALALELNPTAGALPAPGPEPVPPRRASPETKSRSQLERLGQAVERHAEGQGAHLEFLGVEALFDVPRLYGEGASPWVLCPAAADPLVRAGLPIPAAQRRQLDRIVNAGMDFPHLYLAHEVARDRSRLTGRPDFAHCRTLTADEARRLIVRPNAPASTRNTAKRVDRIARSVGRGIGLTATGAATALVAPLALLADGLDPAVLGALTIPGAGATPGTPAAWFLLARWDW